ncbi:hypothetical protein PFICI_02220 [Pestalotiopsis fici W106-1]|uniref:Arb2 domain-containing protein n=1 Tax=Pestalotiopsis fici (strain W106-1 / CGMCC3.15140) TaxID=1229662 RepID=W3XDR7_PESFW|nr:uncharacterized protein PFICI_02220 [Pestalotiopsis fici W106-1]ETS84195.1 hypothetical protein PFICI_02220 [Pestalotiopsis fici W106-1]
MFYRPWEELPSDPEFPSDLGLLGYFVNDEDEIRSIQSPDHYFKFHIDKNSRYNERQRYAMNEAIENLVHARLESHGLEKIRLPLGTPSDKPNVPIFVSSDIKSKSRIILIIGETYQDLGIIAHRILGGRGGVNKGSMVSVVSTLKSQPSSSSDPSPPGFILANTGQFIWHESLKRCCTISGTEGTPMPSAVHAGVKWYVEVGKDRVEGNKDIREHMKTIFETVIPAFLNKDAGLDIIAVGDGADALEKYLDWSETWKRLSDRINCLAILGAYYHLEDLQSTNFREFLREKGRAYATSVEPLGTPLSGPDGNPNTVTFTHNGTPVYSGGESHHVETLLAHALPHLAEWLLEVTITGKKDYRNPNAPILYCDPENEALKMEPDWSKWQNAPSDKQPPADFHEVEPNANVKNDEGGDGGKVTIQDLDDDDCDKDVKELEKTLGMMKTTEHQS